ncbi:MAG: ribonuclease J [Spirochaetia bacterium]|nr:ribonuclease J [Spirochaetia bacterium]
MDLDLPGDSSITRIIRDRLKENELYVCFGGGVGSFGKNFTIFYFNDTIIWLDVGCGFPSQSLPGLRRIIPPKELIEAFPPDAIIFTHAHEDHVGALPYICSEMQSNIPIFSSDFTLAIIKRRLREYKINLDYFAYNPLKKNTKFQVGNFNIHNFFMPHSIPQTFAVGLEPAGTGRKIFFTSDFKIEGNEERFNESDIRNFGPVDFLFCDSTGTLNSGKSIGESIVAENLESVIKNWRGRIFMTTFASQIDRLIQIHKIARKYNRRLGIRGQSIISHLDAALEAKIMDEPFWYNRKPDAEDKQALWLISGCQADEGSSLFRFAEGKLLPLKPEAGDLLVYSASIIPSNVDQVHFVLNKIAREGVKITGLADYDLKVHASGHARMEDIGKMISWLDPRVLIPVHGDHIHFMGFPGILGANSPVQFKVLDDNCIYKLNAGITEVMRLPFIPQLIEEGEIHTEYSLYSHRTNLSRAGICNLIISEKTKKLEQIQYIGTASQGFLKKSIPELSEKIQGLIKKLYDTNGNIRDRKLKQKIGKLNYSILKKDPYINIIWI